jgi:cytochrome P450
MDHVESYILYVIPLLNRLPTRKNKIFNSAIRDFDKFVFEIIDLKRIELAKRKKLNEKKKSNNNEELLVSMLEASEQENINIGKKDLRDNIINFFSAGNDSK